MPTYEKSYPYLVTNLYKNLCMSAKEYKEQGFTLHDFFGTIPYVLEIMIERDGRGELDWCPEEEIKDK